MEATTVQQPDNITTEIFRGYGARKRAVDYLTGQGFEYFRGKYIDMGEGLEHIFIEEYPHKYDASKVCRLADLEFVQRKPREGETVPFLLDYFQVSIKTTTT